MPEARDLPVLRWGEEIRRTRLALRDRRSRSAVAVATAVSATILIGTALWQPRPRLVWNASASAPVGLYVVSAPERLHVGETVVAWPPEPARTLAAGRHYLPFDVPLVKRLAAGPGDRVCAVGEAIWINGRHVAARRLEDEAGRPMPWWTGCSDLREGEHFLLMDHPASFDGRYFGVTGRDALVGRAVPLWTR